MLNKRGAAGGAAALWVLVAVAIVVAATLVLSYVNLGQQTAAVTDPQAVQASAASAAEALKSGDASTVKFKTQDKASNNNAQVATSISVEEWDGAAYGEGSMDLIADATALSATTTTSVTTEVGKHLKACAFNQSTYYGDCETFKVEGEGPTKTLSSYAIKTMVNLELYDNGVLETKDSGADAGKTIIGNLSLSADQTDALDYMKITQNNSDSLLRLKGFGFNVSEGSNVKDITMTGTLNWDTNNKGQASPGSFAESAGPQRLNQVVDWYFELPEFVSLYEFDSVRTPAVQFVGRGTNPDELVTIFLLDEGHFKSVKQNNRILSGVENDESVEEDVGGDDYKAQLSID